MGTSLDGAIGALVSRDTCSTRENVIVLGCVSLCFLEIRKESIEGPSRAPKCSRQGVIFLPTRTLERDSK